MLNNHSYSNPCRGGLTPWNSLVFAGFWSSKGPEAGVERWSRYHLLNLRGMLLTSGATDIGV